MFCVRFLWFLKEVAGVSLFDHNGIKSYASVFGHQVPPFCQVGLEACVMCPSKRVSGESLSFPVAARDCVQAFSRASSQFMLVRKSDRTQAK